MLVSCSRFKLKFFIRVNKAPNLEKRDKFIYSISCSLSCLVFTSLIYGHPKTVVPVWLRDIWCHGNETELDQCKHSGWIRPKRPLDFYDLAGVICHTDTGRVIEPELSEATKQVMPLKVSKIRPTYRDRPIVERSSTDRWLIS